MNIKVLIVENDPISQETLKSAILKYPYAEIIGVVDSGLTAINMIKSMCPDVVFLDIEILDINGFDVARHINNLNLKIFIVFATAYNFYLSEAFEVYAFDYLVKPYNVNRIVKTLGKIRSLTVNNENPYNTKIVVNDNGTDIFVDIKDIVYVAKEGRNSVIRTLESILKTTETLELIATKLPSNYFIRCHRGYIVNLNMIKKITPWGKKKTYNVTMTTGDNVFMTRYKAKEIEKNLGIHCGKLTISYYKPCFLSRDSF